MKKSIAVAGILATLHAVDVQAQDNNPSTPDQQTNTTDISPSCTLSGPTGTPYATVDATAQKFRDEVAKQIMHVDDKEKQQSNKKVDEYLETIFDQINNLEIFINQLSNLTDSGLYYIHSELLAIEDMLNKFGYLNTDGKIVYNPDFKTHFRSSVDVDNLLMGNNILNTYNNSISPLQITCQPGTLEYIIELDRLPETENPLEESDYIAHNHFNKPEAPTPYKMNSAVFPLDKLQNHLADNTLDIHKAFLLGVLKDNLKTLKTMFDSIEQYIARERSKSKQKSQASK